MSLMGSVVVVLMIVSLGILYPPEKGKIFGMSVMHGASSGSLISSPRRSGPGGITASPSAGAGASSEIGSEVEIAMLRRVGRLFIAATVMHCPLTSLIRMVTGQMISIASPREPAKTASVPLAVGNGQESTVRVGDPFGTSMRKAIWLTRPLSQRLARRASAGRSLENVDAMRRAWVGSAA